MYAYFMKRFRNVKALGLAFLLWGMGNQAPAAIVAAFWDTTGHASENPLPAEFTLEGVSASDISFGSGLTKSPNVPNSIAASGWTTGSTPNSNDFFVFSITVTGEALSLATLDFALLRVNANAPQAFEVRASTSENFSTFISLATDMLSGLSVTNYSLDLTAFDLFENFTGTVYFRIAGYSAVTGAGTLALTNNTSVGSIRVTTTTPIPEPGTFALVAGGLALTTVALRSRKKRIS